jgi:hypothetical protein
VQETQSIGASFIPISPHTSPNEATTDGTKGIEFHSNAGDKPGTPLPCRRYSTRSRRCKTICLPSVATSRRAGTGCAVRMDRESSLPQGRDQEQ